MTTLIRSCGITVLLLLASPLSRAEVDNNGAELYQTCAACHGIKALGEPMLKAPSLRGLSRAYIIRQLNNFSEGRRGKHPQDIGGQQMRSQALTLKSAVQVDAVATFITNLPEPVIDNLEISPATKSKLGAMYWGTCSACHGLQGQGNTALGAPSLRHMDSGYLVSQLQKFKAGIRGSEADDYYGRQMQPMAAMLPDEQAMREVAKHIAGLEQTR